MTIGLYVVARNTWKDGRRALIYAKDPFLIGDGRVPGVDSGKPAFLVVDLTNSGDTPARKAIGNTNYCATVGGLPNYFSFPPSPGTQPELLLPPKGVGQTSFELPNTLLVDTQLGRRNLFVYGVVEYEDVFNERHKTEFCSQYRGFVLQADGMVEKLIWSACDKHNCHDGDCPEKWGNAPCPQIGAKPR